MTIAEGAIVGARAVVVKDVAPWSIIAGNPARVIKKEDSKSPFRNDRQSSPGAGERIRASGNFENSRSDR